MNSSEGIKHPDWGVNNGEPLRNPQGGFKKIGVNGRISFAKRFYIPENTGFIDPNDGRQPFISGALLSHLVPSSAWLESDEMEEATSGVLHIQKGRPGVKGKLMRAKYKNYVDVTADGGTIHNSEVAKNVPGYPFVKDFGATGPDGQPLLQFNDSNDPNGMHIPCNIVENYDTTNLQFADFNGDPQQLIEIDRFAVKNHFIRAGVFAAPPIQRRSDPRLAGITLGAVIMSFDDLIDKYDVYAKPPIYTEASYGRPNAGWRIYSLNTGETIAAGSVNDDTGLLEGFDFWILRTDYVGSIPVQVNYGCWPAYPYNLKTGTYFCDGNQTQILDPNDTETPVPDQPPRDP